MDDPEQARAYARADFAEPHQAFVDHFKRCFAHHRVARALDLGCGPADITVRFAKAHPGCEIVGVDTSEAMLAFGLGGRGTQRTGAPDPRALAIGLSRCRSTANGIRYRDY